MHGEESNHPEVGPEAGPRPTWTVIGEPCGSDHAPLIVDLVLPATP